MSYTAENIWNAAQQLLRDMLKPEMYQLWFAPLRAVALNEDQLTLEVSDEFCELWLKDNYLDVLQAAVSRASLRPITVSFCVVEGGTPAPAAAMAAQSAPLFNKREAPPTPAEVEAESASKRGESPFNPNNTFETFVVGSNNNLAHGASLAVAQNPGKAFNPLFLFGGVGLGKTHLLQAVGHHVLGHKQNARIAYLSCERFTNEFIEALQHNQLTKFRKKYRQLDVLLIDDVQFLAGKERIQEEFFHTFNTLHENRKQIVLTCDRPASEIQGLEERLVSRFEWGQTADVQAPDIETRLAILHKKAKSLNAVLSEEHLLFLATRIRTNIRRLEGALIRVAAYSQLTHQTPSIETVESLLREILQEEGRQVVSIEQIQKRVAEHYDLRLADMASKRRPENIAFPRQIAMYLARHLTPHSLSSIGEAFGGRDHGTVLHACRTVKDRMEVDAQVRQTVGFLEKQLMR
ncbi:MAG TPA: chromosomal replication initiator protein DnaA [Candidatus Limnocylindria bacterium]|nr:chromosomal replication initiator protein DnaA [Candidatus Limnocylindria bacterium]